MSDERGREIVTHGPLRLHPDVGRVIAMLFIPGEEMPGGGSRASSVIDRILAMDDAEVTTTLADVRRRFAHRHRRLDATWSHHFVLAAHRAGHGLGVSADRALLIGAYFTRECSLEAAALFNPSIVAHPNQSGTRTGETRFVMSLRAVGEGHISSIEFRTGIIDGVGGVRLDDPGTFLDTGQHSSGPYQRHLVTAKLTERGCDVEAIALLVSHLAPEFGPDELEIAIDSLHRDLPFGPAVSHAVECIRWVAANNYTITFPADTTIAERVLWPSGPAELDGMEDARFVRFVDDRDTVTYLATYTAFDRPDVAPQQLSTTDFRTFVVSQLSGPYATNKGMALFPRKVGGRYLALSRRDRERSAVTMSDDGSDWSEATTLDPTLQPWQLIQVGNCGSPLETPEGWLVLTHGVGPMREYSIGALLLDLDDPCRVIGTLSRPLLVASDEERDGYVPNVVYSCGALIKDETLILPYAFADIAVGVALVDLPELLGRLTGSR